MFIIRRPSLSVSILIIVATITVSAFAQTSSPPDATLFTTYEVNPSTSVYWTTCGSTQQSEGCFASGSLGSFGKVGALLEGNPSVNSTTNTVTRSIYVLDVASGSNQNGVKLYVYLRTDTVMATSDSVSVRLYKSVILPLTGGTAASFFMAANNKFLFIGTNQGASPFAVEVQKGTYVITPIGAVGVSAITANKYGYVTVTFGSGASSSFHVFGPDGSSNHEEGGGTNFMLNTIQAALPSTFQ